MGGDLEGMGGELEERIVGGERELEGGRSSWMGEELKRRRAGMEGVEAVGEGS